MIARLTASRFAVLYRTFVAQFFASESATSDHAVRQAIIGILAFLVVPGFLLPLQMDAQFGIVARHYPALLDPLVRLVATIFITYSIVSIGVVAAFAWDALGFDRRDAMVLGPLPVSGATVIAAKLAALAALLLGASVVVALITAFSFSMVASDSGGFLAMSRHFAAHVIATLTASTFAFGVLVTLRALVGMVGGGRVAVASVVQFALVSALLCFIVLVPTAFTITTHRGHVTVFMQPIPWWSPTNWFVRLYETARGSNVAEFRPAAMTALALTLIAVAAAILATIASYRRQLQLALTPTASARTHGLARLLAAISRALAGRHPVARATSDFVLTTMLRSRAQQAPVAINAAVAVAVAAAAFSRAGGDREALSHPRTIVLWIPLLLAYWTIVGLRAAFHVPSELPASWTFRANAPAVSRACWSGTRVAMTALVAPPAALLAAAVTVPLFGWRIGVWHTAFVLLLVAALVELVALTLDALPFARPYRPGHAKLKTRWPLYLLGMYAFAVWPVRMELLSFGGAEPRLLAYVLAAIVALHLAGLAAGARWSVDPREEAADDLGDVSVLDIGGVVHGAHIGG